MKKIIYTLVMVLMLSFSAVCSAAGNGQTLDAEEAIVNKFLAATNYKVLVPLMTTNMKNDFTEEVFTNFRQQVDKNFGKLLEHQLFALQKYPDGDQLRYACIFEKEPEAQYIFLFIFDKGKPMLEKFALTLPPKSEPGAEEEDSDAEN